MLKIILAMGFFLSALVPAFADTQASTQSQSQGVTQATTQATTQAGMPVTITSPPIPQPKTSFERLKVNTKLNQKIDIKDQKLDQKIDIKDQKLDQKID